MTQATPKTRAAEAPPQAAAAPLQAPRLPAAVSADRGGLARAPAPANPAPSARDGAPCAAGTGTPDPTAISALVGTRLADVEDALIDATVAHCGESVVRAAHLLGLSPSTLYRRRASQPGASVGAGAPRAFREPRPAQAAPAED